MGMMQRKAFSRGWTPNADAVDAPPGTLLRADNMILDERDVLSLRRGSSKINAAPLADLDIHSLHTQFLDGVKYRMVGAGQHVYSNSIQLPELIDAPATSSIQFGTHMGQIFYARTASKYKYDGSLVWNWGIEMTGGAATAVGSGGGLANTSELLSGNNTEFPAVIWEVGSGGFVDDRFSAPNSAISIEPDGGGQGVINKSWPTPQNFNFLGTDSVLATDDSVVYMWVYIPDPSKIFQISLQISINGETIWSDVYATIWFISEMADRGEVVVGWNKLTVRRGDMVRGGPGTAGVGWDTVQMVRVVVQGNVADPGTLGIDEISISGGTTEGAILGEFEYAYLYVRDNGSYIVQSAHSPFSANYYFDISAATVTIPADPDRDGQVNQIWLFRRGGLLDDWYRVAVQNIATSGAVDIVDTLTDQDALEVNIVMPLFNSTPPDGIIGIEGPYYDRLFALTPTHLYPSRRLMPDTFDTRHVIRVAGADETALWVKKAFNGLYIGTTKDIYRLDGTGAEFPDGTMEFTLTPLNIDNPPRSEVVAQEGNLLVLMAADGWRAFTGAGTQLIVAETSLLYQGQDRHGVESINTSDRFRAAIVRGQLVAITPEGDGPTKSEVLYRYTFASPRWYRHVYSPQWRSIFREPDGTLIAGDDSGHVWILDEGDEDDGNPIPVTILTARDDDGNGYAPKVAVGFMVNVDSGGDEFQIQLYSDDDGNLMDTVTGETSSMLPVAFDISDTRIWRQLQLRITGSFTRFRLSSFTVPYQALPMGVKAWDSGPMNLGQQDIVWARRVQMKLRAGANLTVTPYFDGVAFDTVTIEVGESVDQVTILEVPVGRGYFGRVPRLVVTSSEDFFPFWTEFIVRRTTEESEKPNIRIPSGLGGESDA